MKKILCVFGTRPEAIKMCPLVIELKKRPDVSVKVCLSGQHREIVYPVLERFSLRADYDLSVMKASQTLFDVTGAVMTGVRDVLLSETFDTVLVHGDTTTALAAFYLRVPVGHVEAGLRTGDMSSPFPEEFNRVSIDRIARFCFAPTDRARRTLLAEGKDPDEVFLTGNTVIDALGYTVRPDFSHPVLDFVGSGRLVLVTAHRRENVGEPMYRMFGAIRRLAQENPDLRVVYPVHPNPAVRKIAEEVLSGCENILLCDPIGVFEFHNLLARAAFVMTDSGGIQEEAAALGKPLLVMREHTERAEGIAAGICELVGTDGERIYRAASALACGERPQISPTAVGLYGDGTASEKIADILCH